MSSYPYDLLYDRPATSSKRQLPDNDKDSASKKIKSDDRKRPHGNQENITPEKICSIFSDKPKEHHASGIKNTLHGSIYQLKLLMLFVRIGVNNNYQFRLATEMTAAEKFDDLVFQFQNNKNGITHRFLQAKHRQDESQKITVNDLLSENDGDFSLQKYFISFRRIKQNLKFEGDLQDLILCTNINLDFDKLEQVQIKTEEIIETDDFFPNAKNGKFGARYKLILNQENQIYEKLRETSDIYMLAKLLIKHIKDQKPLNLTCSILKSYHKALVDEQILVIEEQLAKNNQMKAITEFIGKFNEKFINYNFKVPNDPKNDSGLSESAKKLREILQDHLDKTNDLSLDKNTKFKLPSTFGKGFKLESNPQLTNIKQFTDELVKLVIGAQDYVIIINARHYRKNSKEINVKTVADNINKLAGHVLIIKDEKIQFKKSFFDDSIKLPGNLEEFKDIFKNNLQKQGIQLNALFQYEMKIGGDFKTCEEEQLSTKTVLPNDKIEDEEIKEFFEKLVFAVDQPNEVNLSDIIKYEMGEDSQFNLLNANLVTDSFEIKMLDWFKEKGPRKGKEGTWISHENVQKFFDSIEAEVNTLVTIGISVPYPAELEEYGIEFKTENPELRYFLNSNGTTQIFNIVNSTETFLSAYKVYRTLANLPAKYKHQDSYIFMRLSAIIKHNIHLKVTKAFKSSNCHNLLVIDCDVEVAERYTQELYTELTKIINNTNCHNKKVILITIENNALANKFETNPKYKNKYKKQEPDDYDTHFSDLTQTTQVNLLEKPIEFQGENISLNKLLDLSDENTKKIINSETLVMIIKNEKIKIGNKLKKLGEINDYYIPRIMYTQVSFNKAKLKKDIINHIITDFFVITGTDSGLAGVTNKIFIFDNNNVELACSKFRKLCEQNSNSNIHWLKCKSGKLIWQETQGSISSLVKNREIRKYDRTFKKVLTENSYLEEKNSKILIIADTAGMGKSTVLTSLSYEMKKINPSLLIIRIDLHDYTTVLAQEIENKKIYSNKDVVEFLINNLLESKKKTKLTTKFERDFFANCINGQGKIVFCFDGFDEISPNYQDVVIDILQALKKTNVEKILVTTRPNMRIVLEEKLEVFSDILLPFSKPNQIVFFTKFWIKNLQLKDLNQEHEKRLNTYADSLIEKFSTAIKDKVQEFIGIPLQSMMLAEIFQENTEGIQKKLGEWEGCKEFLATDNTNQNPKLPDKFDLLGLYEHFIDKKYRKFYLEEKEHRDLTKPGAKKCAEENFENFTKRHSTMALSELLSDDDLKKLLSMREIQKLNDWIKDIATVERNEGIIDKVIDNKPHFIHRTFAEYFASFSLFEKMQVNHNVTCSVVNSILGNTSPVFISSLANILNKEKLLIPNYSSVLDYITKNKESYLIFLNALLEIDYQDDLGRTSLHYAVKYNNENIIDYVLNYKHDILGNDILRHGNFKNKEYENSNLVKFVNTKDNQGNTALDYADDFKLDIPLSFKLLLRGANIDGLTQKYRKILTKYMLYSESGYHYDHPNHTFNANILGAYANDDNKFRTIQEKLLVDCSELFPDLNRKDQCRLLSYLFVHARVKVIDTLLKSITNEKERKELLNAKDNGFTPLDRVNGSYQISDDERLDITKYLLQNGGNKVECNVGWSHENFKSYITTILQAAAINGHIKTFEHFIHKEDRDYFHLHIYTATYSQQFNIIEYLMKNHREYMEHDGFTPLHNAVDSRASLKIIKYCIDKGEKINAKNHIGETPLFQAIYKPRLNVIKYLVNQGADVNIVSQRNFTVLNHAIEQDERDIIKYLLLECEGNVKFTSELITNKMQYYEDSNNFNLNLVDHNGKSRLHLAIQSTNIENIEWAKFIIKEGADINIIDREGKTPLHWASKLELTEIVELLLKYGAIFDAKDIYSRTPYDLLSQSGSKKIIWLLNVLKILFSSKNLIKDLDELFFKRELGRHLKDWGPYGSGHADSFDSDNPMIFILNAKNADGLTLLHIAADTNDQPAINIVLQFNHDYLKIRKCIYSQYSQRYLYYKSISIDAIDSNGNTALHFAAQQGHEQMVSLLLDRGAIFNGENYQGKTPEELAKNNHHDNITQLMQPTRNLFIAIEQNSLDEIKYSFQGNAYINAKDKHGKTPLHLAVSSQRSDIVQFLIKMGANIVALDVHDQTPLHYAAENNKIENVKLLLKYGAIFNARNKLDKTPFEFENNQSVNLLNAINLLFSTIESENPEIFVDCLKMVERDYNVNINTIVNVRDYQWNTILHYAAQQNDINIVKLLLENGAIFDALNILNETANGCTHRVDITLVLESIAEMFKNIDNIYQENETVNAKIIINVRNTDQRTLLHNAAECSKLYIIQRLVRAGADINAVDKDSKTPLHLVAQHGTLDSAKFLIENGADATLEDKNGKTALQVAEDCNNLEILQFLVTL